MKKTVALIFILYNVLLGYSNNPNDSIPVIHFQIVDATNEKPVSLAHVINAGQRKGVIADMLGYFKMPIALGDTLIITALSYHQMRIPSWGQFCKDSLYYPIRLTPKSYEIKELRITRFGSYQRFIHDVARMDFPKSDTELLQEKLEEYFRKQITRMNLIGSPSQGGGFVFGKDWIAIQKEKVEERKAIEQKWDLMLKKFSARIVNDLTDLEGVEAIKFMDYCDFTESFLLLASDYEIRKRILDKFEDYKRTKSKENELTNHN